MEESLSAWRAGSTIPGWWPCALCIWFGRAGDIIQSNYSDDGLNPISQRKIFYFWISQNFKIWILLFICIHFIDKSLANMHILRGKIKRPIRIYIAEIMPTNVVGKQKNGQETEH